MNVELTTDVNSNNFVDGNSSTIQIGYKHTELGPVPLGWSIVAFGQIVARTQLGGNYKNSESDTGLPLIKMGNLGRGFVKLHKQEFIIGEASESDLLSYGDVLFNTRNTLELVGKVAIWKNELPKAYFNSNLMRISFKDEFVSSNIFMNALMNTEKFIKSLSDIAIGTTSVAAIYNRDLFQIKLVLPTKEEQTAIANALSDVDALIQELEKLIAKKQAIKTATMQQLLTGRTRLPQFAHHPDGRKKGYKPSELGEIPEDWDIKCIRNVIDNERGVRYGIVQPGKYDANGRLMVRGQDYSKGWVNEHDIFRVSDAVEYRYRNARLKAGDLIITIVGAGTGHVEIVPSWLDGANLTQTTARMTINPNLANSRFVRAALLSTDGQARIASFIKGNAQPGLNCFDIYGFEFVSPLDVNEQNAVAEIVSDMDKDIQSLEIRLGKTRQIKQGMMQELLTGKTRLVKPAGSHADAN